MCNLKALPANAATDQCCFDTSACASYVCSQVGSSTYTPETNFTCYIDARTAQLRHTEAGNETCPDTMLCAIASATNNITLTAVPTAVASGPTLTTASSDAGLLEDDPSVMSSITLLVIGVSLFLRS